MKSTLPSVSLRIGIIFSSDNASIILIPVSKLDYYRLIAASKSASADLDAAISDSNPNLDTGIKIIEAFNKMVQIEEDYTNTRRRQMVKSTLQVLHEQNIGTC